MKSIRKPNRVKDIAETGKYFVQQYGSLESNIRKINENVKNIENRNNFFLRAKILCLAIIYFFDQFFLMGLRRRVL